MAARVPTSSRAKARGAAARRSGAPLLPETPAPARDSGVSRSELLRLKIALAGDDYEVASRSFWRHRRLRALIPEHLFRIHTIIRASVPVMEAARDRAVVLSGFDPLSKALAEYLGHHIPEERHHDDWLLDDLEVLGMKRPAVWARQPSQTVASLVGAQYYWIHHYHPVAVLGYIAVLEGTPPDESHINAMIARTKLPAKAFRTFIKHARLDPHHRDDLNDALDTMPIDPVHEALIATSAIETQHLLAKSLRELLED